MPDGARSSHPAVQRELDRLSQRSPGRDVLGLERISALLKRVGNPHLKMPPIFHVAGTNGKGSTCAFLRAAIEASGLTTHVYTSPHLVRFNERIRVAGKVIEDDMLAKLLEETNDAANGLGASFFEITTAAAFLAFSRISADACIIEVGLGGRLDATNIIAEPAVCGIAHLGLDHEGFLLSAEPNNADLPSLPLPRIAYEKAGIAKADVPLVVQKYKTDMQLEIAKQAMRKGARLIDRGDQWDVGIYKDRLHYRDDQGSLSLPLPKLAGPFQVDNAALAIAMLRHQDVVPVTNAALSAAMGWVKWPARLEKLVPGPIASQFDEETEIWLDGGHNALAGQALKEHFADIEEGSLHLIIGMLSNKSPASLILPLKEKLSTITVVPIVGHEHHDCDVFRDKLGQTDIVIRSAPSLDQAVKRCASANPATVLIAGSLYLAGEVLALNKQIPN